MIKRVLIYHWGALGDNAFVESMRSIGMECILFSRKMEDYHADGEYAKEMLSLIHEKRVEAVFSYDYFPLISMLCDMNHIPYVSWIYDCPMNTLMSGTLGNECNYIFCFDAWYTERLRELGAKHIYHFPLAIEENTLEMLRKIESEKPELAEKYNCSISFVGNMYNGEKNRLRRAELTEYTHGYVEGLIKSQMLIFGYNLLADSLQPQIVEEIVDKCELKLGDNYISNPMQMAADAIGIEVTAREREQIIKVLSDRHPLTLYSSYAVEEAVRGQYLQEKGYADYESEMPHIFYNSKINLNITSRTIQSGIPKRVLDILACGGFCLTNYQPEIAEYFEDGVDLVMYSGMADLAAKAEYYLGHEEERIAIAENGNRKVREGFDLKKRVAQMWEVVMESCN
ncbi:MAG: glycosyltransferase [Lachnospiraceae bacterium]|nr:glycosyltransferase [Lachnospiraceae bacterium]